MSVSLSAKNGAAKWTTMGRCGGQDASSCDVANPIMAAPERSNHGSRIQCLFLSRRCAHAPSYGHTAQGLYSPLGSQGGAVAHGCHCATQFPPKSSKKGSTLQHWGPNG